MKRILVIGAGGQIGTELVLLLEKQEGKDVVFAADIKSECPEQLKNSNYFSLDVLDKNALSSFIKSHQITEVYLLAALLSATAEKQPEFAWRLNMEGLFNVLNLAKEGLIEKIFWPSSIAVFGPTTPKTDTPQRTIMEPNTVYGISKQAGQQWCEYYHTKFGVDVRSIRYPGLISYKALPGGGTTDYAVDIFYHAKKYKKYISFLSGETELPMMFMEDAVRATYELMNAPANQISIRNGYNLAAVSFTPKQLAKEIQQHFPDFRISYKQDERQTIADSWPHSIDDCLARKDWGWSHQFSTAAIVQEMLTNVRPDIYFTTH